MELIPTGVPNLDAIVGGGIPELSLTVVAGPVGSGKTTLGQQFIFHNATAERPAVYFATIGEPTVKLLRYQQQFTFFRPEKVGLAVHYVDLSAVALEQGLAGALAAIRQHLERLSPRIVVMDSLRAIEDLLGGRSAKRAFIHDLAVLLATWQCTSLVIGEYTEEEISAGAEFTIADNVIFLSQEVHGNMAVRRLRVVKMRGLAPQAGRHTFRIDRDGIQIFPRMPQIAEPPRLPKGPRARFGVKGLDEMTHGGLPRGQTCIVAGSSGTGKTLLSLHFAVAGADEGEPAVVATFEETPAEHAEKMASFGWNLGDYERRNLIEMVYLRPVDLTIDEVAGRLSAAVERTRAQRVIINSISGLQTALPPSERAQLRDGLYRLLAALTAGGVTVLLTTETPDLFGEVRISEEAISFLADNIILLRYVEISSELRKALMVVKMRTSDHAKELREYRIGRMGITVEKSFAQYSGVMTGIPTLRTLLEPQPFTAGLSEQEEALMHTLLALRQSTAQDLADAQGMPVHEAQAALDKLVDTGYVLRTTRGGQPLYRVALVTPGGQQGRR